MNHRYHPECLENEVFFENVYELDMAKINKYNNSESYRIGEVSYDSNRFPIPEMKPVFILKSAFNDEMKKNRMSSKIDISKLLKESEKMVANFKSNGNKAGTDFYSAFSKEGMQILEKFDMNNPKHLYYCNSKGTPNESK